MPDKILKNLDEARSIVDRIAADYAWHTKYELADEVLSASVEVGRHTIQLSIKLDEERPEIFMPDGDNFERLDDESFWRQAYFHLLDDCRNRWKR